MPTEQELEGLVQRPEARAPQSSEPLLGAHDMGQASGPGGDAPPRAAPCPLRPRPAPGTGAWGVGERREGSIICAGFSMGNYSRDCGVSMLARGHCLGATVKRSLTVKGKRQACGWEERMGGGESKHPRTLMVVST